MSSRMSLSLNVISLDDLGESVEVPSDVPISRIVPRILEHLYKQQGGGDSDNFTLFVAKQVSALPQEMEKTLSELNVRNGDALYLVRLNTSSSKVQFFIPGETQHAFEISNSPTVIGRDKDDPELAAYPLNIDLSPYLRPEQYKLISRRQARFIHDDGQWYIQLHERSRAPIFVDNQQLTAGKWVRLQDETLITIGSENKFSIHFNVRLA